MNDKGVVLVGYAVGRRVVVGMEQAVSRFIHRPISHQVVLVSAHGAVIILQHVISL